MIDDPALMCKLGEGLGERENLTLLRSELAMTDCHSVSLFSSRPHTGLVKRWGSFSTNGGSGPIFFMNLASTPGTKNQLFVH